MGAAYDKFDYPHYWEGREYEHQSELIALKSFLEKIPQIRSLADIGAGYGRLTDSYLHRAKKIVLIDPSNKLLSIAKKTYKNNKSVTTKQSKIENMTRYFRKNSFDLIIMVRVLHHLKTPEIAFSIAQTRLKPGGYLILEYPNKIHFKQLLANFLRGNFTYSYDILEKDRRSKENKKENTLPFNNFHPEIVKELLHKNKFTIIEKRSVSNFRSDTAKNQLPLPVLTALEEIFQPILAYFNIGPSIFILAQKKKR